MNARALGLIALCATAPAAFAAPWHLAGWQARAVVEIKQTEPDTDVAGVKVLCMGRGKPDGSDYRVVDAAGKAVPFQVMWHDATRYSLIAFQAKNPRQPYSIYFGNPQAAPVTEDWQPQCGLILETMQRAAGDNPKTFEEMQKLMAGSKAKYGARWQRRISDDYNSFGPSDYYISIYRGWMKIPKAGRYRFCTASNEASFSFMDGKPLVHWPGRHTEERGIHGEKNAEVELTEGLHYVEYYHEEVTLQQMAFLGWQPPGAERLWAIPESVYTAPHDAVVTRYESPNGPLPVFEPEFVDSVWPESRADAQYTRVRFRTADPAAQWNFGDGQPARGALVEHVYLANGHYQVTLAGASWPLEVYEIQHTTDQLKDGNLADYLKLVQTYDRTKLDPASLREWTWLMARQAKGEEARAYYEALRKLEVTPEHKIEALAHLIELGQTELLAEAEQITRASSKSEEVLAAFRQALIAGGDANLWNSKTTEARELYRRAEALNPQMVPPRVRAALVGSYPELIRDYLNAGQPDAAADVLDKWERQFPTDKLTGQPLFWRGRLLAKSDQRAEAARYLAKAVALAKGAPFEAEAKRLLAEMQEKTK